MNLYDMNLYERLRHALRRRREPPGVFHTVQAALPDMMDAGWGRVVTISSQAGQSGAPNQVHYSASKGGVIALTKSLGMNAISITDHPAPSKKWNDCLKRTEVSRSVNIRARKTLTG